APPASPPTTTCTRWPTAGRTGCRCTSWRPSSCTPSSSAAATSPAPSAPWPSSPDALEALADALVAHRHRGAELLGEELDAQLLDQPAHVVQRGGEAVGRHQVGVLGLQAGDGAEALDVLGRPLAQLVEAGVDR